MKFVIEQIAIAPRHPAAAKQLLIDMGFGSWIEDHVTADGFVFGELGSNEADLSFNYDAFAGKEFEILNYTTGDNWIARNDITNANGPCGTVSHIGMHCTSDELDEWRSFFAERGIDVAQEVITKQHTNPYLLENGRKYNYVIFDTREILGVDVKFIVRIEHIETDHHPV